MNQIQLKNLVDHLISFPENEWIEFKENNSKPEEVGEYLSALSNSALLSGQSYGYLVFGIEDETHTVKGTNYRPKQDKVGNELVEAWLARLLEPRVDFSIYEVEIEEKRIILFRVDAATRQPVAFRGTAYVRVGSYKKKLQDYPEKMRKIWVGTTPLTFESGLAIEGISADQVLRLLDYTRFFDLFKLPLPPGKLGVLTELESERLIIKDGDKFGITQVGALLFARRLPDFAELEHKAVRLIFYRGRNKLEPEREIPGKKGYAIGFEGLISYIMDRLPENEILGQALRMETKMYPDVAIRELVANALIHQDLTQRGTNPLIEVYEDRIEITNNGRPLIDPLRFLDEVPRSRNEALATLMRKARICEERGSGIDKVVKAAEIFQLPAPSFDVKEKHTVATLYAYRPLREMNRGEKIRACYQHACLRYVSNDQMSNSTLRERFGIEDKNYSMASRIIADTIEAGLVKEYDPSNKSKRQARYVPFWALGLGEGPMPM